LAAQRCRAELRAVRFARRRLSATDLKSALIRSIARTLTDMATKTKVKACLHCGHAFDPTDRHRLAEPDWLPVRSLYCSPECSDRYHVEMVHCCSTQVKAKARREAARAAR
jgi:hypothetical protein